MYLFYFSFYLNSLFSAMSYLSAFAVNVFSTLLLLLNKWAYMYMLQKYMN